MSNKKKEKEKETNVPREASQKRIKNSDAELPVEYTTIRGSCAPAPAICARRDSRTPWLPRLPFGEVIRSGSSDRMISGFREADKWYVCKDNGLS